MRSSSMTPAEGTDLVPGFRGTICASFGTSAAHAEEDTGDRPRHELRFDSANPESLARLRTALEQACVGVRLVLAGPPADIHAAAATAAASGLMEEEVTLLSDGTGPRVVFCAHCRTATETLQAIGSQVDCQGCATTLAISSHFSRRIAGYLGFKANAEEAA
jgi:dimethylamine monooxygenase subunit C